MEFHLPRLDEYSILNLYFGKHIYQSFFNQEINSKNKIPSVIVANVITIDTMNDTNTRIIIGNGSMTINNPMK